MSLIKNMSVRNLVRRWESHRYVKEETEKPKAKRVISAPMADSTEDSSSYWQQDAHDSGHLADIPLRKYSKSVDLTAVRLSVILEPKEEDEDEDVEDAALEFPLDQEEIEAEFMMIELAQAALNDIIEGLADKKKQNRQSLSRTSSHVATSPDLNELGLEFEQPIAEDKIEVAEEAKETDTKETETKQDESRDAKSESSYVNDNIEIIEKTEDTKGNVKEEEEEKVKEVSYEEIHQEAIELAGKSYDKQVRKYLPIQLEKMKHMFQEAASSSVPVPPPMPPMAPPPPPPPLPPGMSLKPSPLKLQLSKKEPGLQKVDVELRVKKPSMANFDLMSQLQKTLRKRVNRDSLKLKYEKLNK